jgi:H+/Cl- antiporter ClcA
MQYFPPSNYAFDCYLKVDLINLIDLNQLSQFNRSDIEAFLYVPDSFAYRASLNVIWFGIALSVFLIIYGITNMRYSHKIKGYFGLYSVRFSLKAQITI